MSSFYSRRKLIQASVAALGAWSLQKTVRANLSEEPKVHPPRNAFVYRFNIGRIEAWSISDGHMLFNDRVDKMWPPEQRDAMIRDLAAHGERTDGLPLYVNVLVLRLGREVVLFDGGFGERSNQNIGWLAQGLQSIGIAPDAVTHAILSHGHSDHIGGFVHAGNIVFPNAGLHVLKEEVEFWRGKAPDFSESHRRDDIPAMIRDVRNAFEVLQPNLQVHRAGDQLLNGAITFEAAPGHTDGHCVLRIRDGRESLVHIMDVAHNHVLMFTDPSWFIEFDHRPSIAVATRKSLFNQLNESGERAFGFHLPWPGLGRVVTRAPGFAWEQERWSWGS